MSWQRPPGPATRGPGRAEAHLSPTSRRIALLAPLAAGLLALLLVSACGRDLRREEAAQQARSQALIDQGNAFYRAGDFGNAAKRYAAAVVTKKDDPAAYFGLGMALTRLGRDEEARAAYAQARTLAQEAREAHEERRARIEREERLVREADSTRTR